MRNFAQENRLGEVLPFATSAHFSFPTIRCTSADCPYFALFPKPHTLVPPQLRGEMERGLHDIEAIRREFRSVSTPGNAVATLLGNMCVQSRR